MPAGDRRGDRAAEARDDGRHDRPAHRGAGQVPGLVGRGHLRRGGNHMVPPTSPRPSPHVAPKSSRLAPPRRAKPGFGASSGRRAPLGRSDREARSSAAGTSSRPDRPPRGRRGRPARPAPPARRGGRARVHLRAEVAEAIRTLASAALRRSGSQRRTATRSPHTAARISRRRTTCSAVAADGGQPRLGARRDARRPNAERARRIHDDEVERCRRMAAHAARCSTRHARLTHCNTGGLATGGYGSARRRVRAPPGSTASSRTSGWARRGRCSRALG